MQILGAFLQRSLVERKKKQRQSCGKLPVSGLCFLMRMEQKTGFLHLSLPTLCKPYGFRFAQPTSPYSVFFLPALESRQRNHNRCQRAEHQAEPQGGIAAVTGLDGTADGVAHNELNHIGAAVGVHKLNVVPAGYKCLQIVRLQLDDGAAGADSIVRCIQLLAVNEQVVEKAYSAIGGEVQRCAAAGSVPNFV